MFTTRITACILDLYLLPYAACGQERLVKLDGQSNFRDVGGYKTEGKKASGEA